MLKFYFRRIKVFRVKRKVRKRIDKKYLENKEKAREVVLSRLEHFNKHYNFDYKKVSIRNQGGRWGSCSSKGNLNFNYRIVLLPTHLADYIVVHELCHMGQLNHSQKFWNLVSETLPDYEKLQSDLRKIRIA